MAVIIFVTAYTHVAGNHVAGHIEYTNTYVTIGIDVMVYSM